MMNRRLLKLFMGINTFLIQVSKGKIGTQLGKQKILLMHTVGRKTGKKYITPIAYFPIPNGYFVVASNWGHENNAAWYYNLKNNPIIVIDFGGKQLKVQSREAEGIEYDDLWNIAVDHHPDYLHYKNLTARHIPIVVFEAIP